MDDRIIKIAETYGYESQSQMLIEEMSELTKAICKLNRVEDRARRGPVKACECEEVIKNVKEEMADVEIMLSQLQYFFRMTDGEFKELMDGKLHRQITRLQGEEGEG